ncbi:hypothetical protein [Plantactinospora sp. B5E13]|uniref:hypothetical protein n=1 Tax=Plantactinospora sp. B5E13 TaxID=3153758 RepID=UPI00325EA95B
MCRLPPCLEQQRPTSGFVRTSRADGRLVAHRWSSSSGTWYDQTTRTVVFGRVDPYA